MTTKTLKFRDGDKFIESTITVKDAVIDFQDILDACEIQDDDTSEAPWENCDGWEHTAVSVDRLDGAKRDNAEFMQGYVYHESDREYKLIELEPGEDWGTYDHLRAQGASKQTAREASAATRRKAIEQLVEWYRNGWSYYGVTCEFEGAEASVWGVDDHDYADTDVRQEIASEVAGQLEGEGYTIINYPAKPVLLKTRAAHEGAYAACGTVEVWKERYARNLASQNWRD